MKQALLNTLFLSFFCLLSSSAIIARAQEPRLIELLPRKSIERESLGLNVFANQPEFGSPKEQMEEVRSELGISLVRILFSWSKQVQGDPGQKPDHRFHEELIRSLPRGSEALVVLANMPDWMASEENWIGGDPRLTLYRKWIRPNIRKFRRKKKIKAFQIFNEPNSPSFENIVLQFDQYPEQYLELLKKTSRFMRRFAKKKILVSAATTSILQNFPETLEYNERLLALGILDHIDVFGLHLYGSSVERYYLGVGDFLSSIALPIWVTESGEQGASNQREYVERLWPFFQEEHPNIERFYFYRFAESGGAENTWGLKNSSLDRPLSDLYEYLRESAP